MCGNLMDMILPTVRNFVVKRVVMRVVFVEYSIRFAVYMVFNSSNIGKSFR